MVFVCVRGECLYVTLVWSGICSSFVCQFSNNKMVIFIWHHQTNSTAKHVKQTQENKEEYKNLNNNSSRSNRDGNSNNNGKNHSSQSQLTWCDVWCNVNLEFMEFQCDCFLHMKRYIKARERERDLLPTGSQYLSGIFFSSMKIIYLYTVVFFFFFWLARAPFNRFVVHAVGLLFFFFFSANTLYINKSQ